MQKHKTFFEFLTQFHYKKYTKASISTRSFLSYKLFIYLYIIQVSDP